MPPLLPPPPPPYFQPPPYQIDHTSTSSGKFIQSTKRRIRWVFGLANQDAINSNRYSADCRGEEHEIILTWSLLSGKRVLELDGHEIYRSVSKSRHFWYHFDLLDGSGETHFVQIVGCIGWWEKELFVLKLDGMNYKDMKRICELGGEMEKTTMKVAKKKYGVRRTQENEEEVEEKKKKTVTIQEEAMPHSVKEEEEMIRMATERSLRDVPDNKPHQQPPQPSPVMAPPPFPETEGATPPSVIHYSNHGPEPSTVQPDFPIEEEPWEVLLDLNAEPHEEQYFDYYNHFFPPEQMVPPSAPPLTTATAAAVAAAATMPGPTEQPTQSHQFAQTAINAFFSMSIPTSAPILPPPPTTTSAQHNSFSSSSDQNRDDLSRAIRKLVNLSDLAGPKKPAKYTEQRPPPSNPMQFPADELKREKRSFGKYRTRQRVAPMFTEI